MLKAALLLLPPKLRPFHCKALQRPAAATAHLLFPTASRVDGAGEILSGADMGMVISGVLGDDPKIVICWSDPAEVLGNLLSAQRHNFLKADQRYRAE